MTSPAQPDLSKLRINRDAPPPGLSRAVRRNAILGVVALILVIGAFLGWRRGSVVAVETVVAKPFDAGGSADNAGSSSVTANGYVVARTRASVSAKLPGRIAELRVSEGSTLKKDEIIATLENADYQAQLAQAQAAEATARADLMEARASLATASRDAKRLRDIRTQDSKAVAEQDFDAAQGRESEAQARVQAAEARIGSARAAAGFARANLENTVIRAPFSGTVLRKEAEVGEVVAPSVGGGLTRGAVVTMADLTTLEVEVDVNEAYIARVTGGQPAKITLDAYPDTSFRGRVRQVVPTADRQRATVQVKVSIVDRDPRILPEMGARVDFLDTTHVASGAAPSGPPRFRVPAAAVRELNGQSVVWLVRNGRLESRQVDAGPVSGGFREIRSGLSGGELLLTGGVDEPKAGMRVKQK
ncbi:MAG TPA: efflux RND transporter periplasmic adaptor subunit [Gemmatimonadales bacterium]